ncbi:MAG: hypothetical protein V2I43_22260 [Parvularcula sp.]|jgi:hypothetical protein|nr:hypothetical protein [Parvularcula sp.]
MYVRSYAASFDGARGEHGVFGRETTRGEMDRQSGTATYTGRAQASVIRDGNTAEESGFYEGEATARVDFDTNGFEVSGEMSRSRYWSNGTDRIRIES